MELIRSFIYWVFKKIKMNRAISKSLTSILILIFSYNGISSVYLFQPDLLAIPFTFAIFLFAKKRSIAGVIISLILLLLPICYPEIKTKKIKFIIQKFKTIQTFKISKINPFPPPPPPLPCFFNTR